MLLSLIYAVLSVQSFAMFWSQNDHSWNCFVLWNHTISVTFEGLAGNYLVLSRIWIFLFFQGQIRYCANQIAFYISDDDDDVMKIGRCQWEGGNLCPSWWLPLTGSHLVTQRLRIEALWEDLKTKVKVIRPNFSLVYFQVQNSCFGQRGQNSKKRNNCQTIWWSFLDFCPRRYDTGIGRESGDPSGI